MLKADRTRYDRVEKYIVRDSFVAAREDIDAALRSILPNVVVGTWTAFEALTASLWIKAYDALPAGFKAMDGSQSRIALLRGGSPCTPQKLPTVRGLAGEDFVLLSKFPGFANIGSIRRSHGAFFRNAPDSATAKIDSVLADRDRVRCHDSAHSCSQGRNRRRDPRSQSQGDSSAREIQAWQACPAERQKH